MSNKIYKSTKHIKDIDELADALRKGLSDKFKITVEKVDKNAKGLKKLMSAGTPDTINIKKNGWHGLVVTVSEKTDGIDFQSIGTNFYTPSWIVDQVMGHTGIIDILVGNLIFGKGKDLYEKAEEIIKKEFEAEEVNNSFLNNAKQMMKGKTVFDE